MTFDTVPQTVLFPDLFDKPLVAEFDRQQTSSDGGAVLLKAAERVYGMVKAFARCLVDKRAPDKIRHTLEALVGQRVFGIACGHPDGNDGDRLADDPIPQAPARAGPGGGRAPGVAADAVAVRERGGPKRALPDGVRVGPACHRSASPPPARKARRITIDLDPTDDPTHGACGSSPNASVLVNRTNARVFGLAVAPR